MKKILGFIAVLSLLVVQLTWAQERDAVVIRGIAIDSQGIPLPDGNRMITFKIYEGPNSETPVWIEQVSVPVENGTFSATLGTVTAFDLPLEKPYWLGMKVGDGQELSPRMELNKEGGNVSMTPTGKSIRETLVEAQQRSKNAEDRDGATVQSDGGQTTLASDIQHLDDVIISFSLCVGNDCVNGESFGFDTIRLKENNVRVHFDDTSTSASFPRNDWRIIINDSSNGGGNYFGIEDSSAGRQVFRVDAGAPANALRVDSGGDVGIGTASPVVDLHVLSGNTPTLRLEQDGSSGFTPQTWDLAGNEANLFFRDATNGSDLPFRIYPDAGTDALVIEGGTGDIGMGTNAPTRTLHLRRTAGNTDILVENTSADSRGGIRLRNDVQEYRFMVDGLSSDAFNIVDVNSTLSRFQITTAGLVGIGREPLVNALEVEGDASKTTIGDWLANSDRRLKKNIQGINNALETINKLRPVKFMYNDTFLSKHPTTKIKYYYNFIAQEFREVFPNSVQDDGEGYLQIDTHNVRPVLVGAVQELSKMVDDLQTENLALQDKIRELQFVSAQMDDLKDRMAQLESMFQRPAAPGRVIDDALRQKLMEEDNIQIRVIEEKVDENGRPIGSGGTNKKAVNK